MEAEKRRKYIVLGIAGVMLMLIISIITLDVLASDTREERDYERLQHCSNPEFFQDFMAKYPDSKYIDEVRVRYEAASMLTEEWNVIAGRCDREELSDFALKNPSSPFRNKCLGMIDSIDWFEAKELNSIPALEKYMGEHPNGLYINDAMSIKQRIEERARAAAIAAQSDSLNTEATEQTNEQQ